MIGLTIFLVICLLAIFADVITPYSNATTQVKDARLLAPCAEHIFGTDHLWCWAAWPVTTAVPSTTW